MSGLQHTIQRQRFEFTLSTQEQAHELQEKICSLNGKILVQLMNQLFTECVLPDEIIRLNRVELDLGILSASDLEQQLEEGLREQLDKVLRESIKTLRDAPDKNNMGQICHRNQSKLKVLCYFLQTGMLPWWSANSAAWKPEQQLLQLIETSPKEVEEALRGIASARVVARIVKQFTPQTYSKLLKLLVSIPSSEIEVVINDWIHLLSSFFDAAEIKPVLAANFGSHPLQGKSRVEWVWQKVMIYLLKDRQVLISASSLSWQLIKDIATLLNTHVESISIQLIHYTNRQPSIKNQVITWLNTEGVQSLSKDVKQNLLRSVQQDKSPLRNKNSTEQIVTVLDKQGEVVQPQQPVITTESNRLNPAKDATQKRKAAADVKRDQLSQIMEEVSVNASDLQGDSQSYYVSNAGLVLVWPYLKHFFTTLGLLDGMQFCSIKEQERALLLLQYLVTDQTQWPEHQLLLNKLLCGWPKDEPVAASIEPTKQELQESDELLKSVIENWGALKSTSVAGLQTAFLQREGGIKHQGQGWQIQIARTGYDILLDKLPWGMSFIRLPWMKESLFVEW